MFEIEKYSELYIFLFVHISTFFHANFDCLLLLLKTKCERK